MSIKHALPLLLVALLLPPITAHVLHAGTYGKIMGRVTDKKTGEALVGATVQIVGTTLGAGADVGGNYVIVQVVPGSYTVKITQVGFTSLVMKDVKVIQDLATDVSVQLSERTIELGEVIEVVAQRPLVQKEVSSSAVVISSEEFQNRPIESVQSVVNTAAGVVTFQGQTFVRGSRSTDVVYIVDGVPLTNPITGSRMNDVSKNAVEEIVLMTGGFSAEYGNAMGGVVNVTTKEGGSTYAGALRYKTDKLSSGSQYYQNLNLYDFAMGGPIYNDIRFFFDGFLNTRDMNV